MSSIPLTGKAAIIGSGKTALELADKLSGSGIEVLLLTKNGPQNSPLLKDYSDQKKKGIEILTDRTVTGCSGETGDYRLTLCSKGKKTVREVGLIIILEEEKREPKLPLYGLDPSKNIIPLSKMNKKIGKDKSGNVFFITGLLDEGNPADLREALLSSIFILENTKKNKESAAFILTSNLKVAALGLESLKTKALGAGVQIFKFNKTMPRIKQRSHSSVTINFIDDITDSEHEYNADLLVIDEQVYPDPYMDDLIKIFGLKRNGAGFPTRENISRLSYRTNRRGVLAAGALESAEIKALALESITSLNPASVSGETNDRPCIDPKLCARCLTCFRLCPHQAIELNNKLNIGLDNKLKNELNIANSQNPVISPNACEGCGICLSACPAGAIRADLPLIQNKTDSVSDSVSDRPKTEGSDTHPFLTVFCCRRSAVRAGRKALGEGQYLPRNLKVVEVPCAGSIGEEDIFKAFCEQADGVLILTCHEGNCHSDQGNILAIRRMARVEKSLEQSGFSEKRLAAASLASNMGAGFARILNRFEKTIAGLEPKLDQRLDDRNEQRPD